MERKALYISSSRMSFLGMRGVLESLNILLLGATASDYLNYDEETFDLVIIDLDNSNFGIDDLKIAREFFSEKILVITHDLSQSHVKNMFQLSFESCLTKDCSEEELIEAVEALNEGKKFYCNNVLTQLVGAPDNDNCDVSELSLREIEIVRLIADGKTSKVIADLLFISPHTVNTHRKNIMKKVGVKNSSEVVMYATKKRLL